MIIILHFSPFNRIATHGHVSLGEECIFGCLLSIPPLVIFNERENKKVIDISFCLDQSIIGKREKGKGLKYTRIDFALSRGMIPLIYSFSEYLLNAHPAAGSILGLGRRNEEVREGLSFHRAIFW